MGSEQALRRRINQLLQLQELVMMQREGEAASGSESSPAGPAVQKMVEELPADLAAKVGPRIGKAPLFIVPVRAGSCSACGGMLPVHVGSVLNVSAGLTSCAQCAVLVYGPAPDPTLRAGKRAGGVGIARFSDPSLMIPRLDAGDGPSALAALCSRMGEEGFVDDPKTLLAAAREREKLFSTAVPGGLAFPHVRGAEGGALTLALGTSPEGIPFGSPDGKPTRVFFFMAFPTAASGFYLRMLSGLAQAFREAKSRDKLCRAKTPQTVWNTLSAATAELLG